MLLASVLLCAVAHLVLRGGASEAGESASLVEVLFSGRILIGIAVYGSGTMLWIACLSRLELSLAFPASAVQFLFVFAGAYWILGEAMPALRLIGGMVILLGIGLLFSERRAHRA